MLEGATDRKDQGTREAGARTWQLCLVSRYQGGCTCEVALVSTEEGGGTMEDVPGMTLGAMTE